MGPWGIPAVPLTDSDPEGFSVQEGCEGLGLGHGFPEEGQEVRAAGSVW